MMNKTQPYFLTEDNSYDGKLDPQKLVHIINELIEKVNELERQLREIKNG